MVEETRFPEIMSAAGNPQQPQQQLLGRKRKTCTNTVTIDEAENLIPGTPRKLEEVVPVNKGNESISPRATKKVKKTTKKGSSKYRGVCWLKERKAWRARIEVGGKREHLGYFNTEEQAALAYDERARCFRGSITRLNFPGIYKSSADATVNMGGNLLNSLKAHESKIQKPLPVKQLSTDTNTLGLYLQMLQRQNLLLQSQTLLNGTSKQTQQFDISNYATSLHQQNLFGLNLAVPPNPVLASTLYPFNLGGILE